MIEEKREKRGEQSEEQVNIQEILFRYLIHWPWFVVSVVICIVCAWGYLRLATPVYNISATVLIKDDKKGSGASMSSELERMGLDGFVSSSNNVDNEIEVLRSKSLAREVVNHLGLFVTYEDEDEFPSRELYRTSPVVVSLTPQEADKLPHSMKVNMTLQPAGAMDVQITMGEKEYRKQFEKLPAVFPTDEGTVAFFVNNDTLSSVRPESVTQERHITAFINSPSSVAKRYTNSLSISPTSKMTSVVVISLKNSNARRGKDFINKLLEMYNINANNDKNEVAQKTGVFDMIDKASSKRFEGWPLDSLSINKETGKYFVDGIVGESKDNIIKGQYEKSIVDFLLKSLHVDSNVGVSGTLTVNQVDSTQMASDEDVLAASSQLMKRNKHVYKELSK